MDIAVLALREWHNHTSSARRRLATHLNHISTALLLTKLSRKIQSLATSQTLGIVCICPRSGAAFLTEATAWFKRNAGRRSILVGLCATSDTINRHRRERNRSQTWMDDPCAPKFYYFFSYIYKRKDRTSTLKINSLIQAYSPFRRQSFR